MMSDMVRSEISVWQLPFRSQFRSQNIILSSKTFRYRFRQLFCAQMASKTLKKAILIILSSFFFTCKESCRFLISTRCSAYLDSLRAANMISNMVRSEILVQQLPFRTQLLNLALNTSFQGLKRCRYRLRQLFCAQIASRRLKTRF